MNIPAPRTWDVEYHPTSDDLNLDWRDGLNFLLSPPTVLVYRDSTQTITSGSWTYITFDTESIDTDTMWSAGAADRIVIQTTGMYVVTYSIMFSASTTGYRGATVKRNGGAVNDLMVDYVDASRSYDTGLHGATECLLDSGDYVQLQGYQNSGGSLTTLAGIDYTNLAARLLSK